MYKRREKVFIVVMSDYLRAFPPSINHKRGFLMEL